MQLREEIKNLLTSLKTKSSLKQICLKSRLGLPQKLTWTDTPTKSLNLIGKNDYDIFGGSPIIVLSFLFLAHSRCLHVSIASQVWQPPRRHFQSELSRGRNRPIGHQFKTQGEGKNSVQNTTWYTLPWTNPPLHRWEVTSPATYWALPIV